MTVALFYEDVTTEVLIAMGDGEADLLIPDNWVIGVDGCCYDIEVEF